MLFELIITLVLGILAGTITGIIPGIHINLVATILLSVIAIINLSQNQAIVFIISMAITHTFFDFIPSIFLGAPDSDTALSILPGHEFLLKGSGHHAVLLTLTGSILSIILLFAITPLVTFLIPRIYPFIQQMLGFFLIWTSIFLITRKKKAILITTIIFALAGFLGIAALNSNISEPLLPLLSGLFGASTLVNSIQTNSIIPKQVISKFKITKKELIKPAIATTIVSPIAALFPGVGSSQAAIIGSQVTGKLNENQFLILLGSINTLIMASSFLILFLIQKTRTGAANALLQIIDLDQTNIKIIFATILVTTLFVIPITINTSKIFAKNIHKINYSKISIAILLFLTTIILFFSGVIGFLIFIVSTILGITCLKVGVSKSILMSSLLIPTTLWYLPFF
ncbi:hypothetical protein HN604_00035 [archaeon]|jgi:putative membrane protein|nr:hypothetical protein [archaeon]MBT6182998.1 hypothetical protein [archaeon]MBT6606050.1 hypothetical protein [archaeon]MBT7251693.1 hypothetical protein [archaeon]MBT7660453.1 hypothetical protein [archaeon]